MNTKQTNRRFFTEWYTCDRCGNDYPREMMLVQNGRMLCTGTSTRNCVDQPGRDAFLKDLRTGYEEEPQPLPSVNEDL